MARGRPRKLQADPGANTDTHGATTGYEAELWRMADTLRGSMDAAEYKHVVLGIIFLKYISDAFEERHILLESEREQGADPEDPDEYRAENIFWVPPEAPLDTSQGPSKAIHHRPTRRRCDDRDRARQPGAQGRVAQGLCPRRTRQTAARPDYRPHQQHAQEHILVQENGKDRYVQSVRELSQAFALAVPHEDAIRIRDDVAFFQAVQSVLAKRAAANARPEEELDHAVRQIISRAVASEGVIDIFAAAGLEKPNISILSEEFLAEVRGMPQRNLAVELLQKLLQGEVATRRRKNVVQARSFAQMLEQTLRRYQNRAVEAAQVIEELIQIARELREAAARGEKLGLSEDELAFYDALETNDSAVQVLGDKTLRAIARELVETVRGNVTIDWTLRENVRATLRRLVKRTLRRHGYPPDKQEKATRTVLEQAEVLSADWAA